MSAAVEASRSDLPEAVPLGGLPARQVPVEPLRYTELSPELRAALGPRVRRLGYLGAFFGYAARQPRALAGFHALTEELKAALPDDLVEVVALAVATSLGNDYERVQHERLAATHGRSGTWIRACADGAPSGELTVTQSAVRQLAVGMVARRGFGVDAQLRRVVAQAGQDVAVGVLLLTGRYIAHAHISNALGLTAPAVPPRTGGTPGKEGQAG